MQHAKEQDEACMIFEHVRSLKCQANSRSYFTCMIESQFADDQAMCTENVMVVVGLYYHINGSNIIYSQYA